MMLYGYTDEGGKITFGEVGEKVERQESWARIATNTLKSFFKPQARPVASKAEDDMSLTPEEKADLVKEIGANLASVVAEQVVKPIGERITALEANQKQLSDTLTANQRAEEESKRAAVAEVMGELIANQLSGEALDEAFARVSKGADIAPNAANKPGDKPKFDVAPD